MLWKGICDGVSESFFHAVVKLVKKTCTDHAVAQNSSISPSWQHTTIKVSFDYCCKIPVCFRFVGRARRYNNRAGHGHRQIALSIRERRLLFCDRLCLPRPESAKYYDDASGWSPEFCAVFLVWSYISSFLLSNCTFDKNRMHLSVSASKRSDHRTMTHFSKFRSEHQVL